MIWARLKGWAKTLRRDVAALWLAARDPRTPRLAKALAIALTAYALSPIDLIPDFIPVLGQLDDLIIVPLGILLIVRMIPPEVFADCRRRAERLDRLPASRAGMLTVIAIWAAALALVLWVLMRWL